MSFSKKILAVFLCAVMLLPVCAVGASASGRCACGNDPIVYVVGKQPLYVFNEDGTKTEQLVKSDLDIGGIAKKVLPILGSALKTGDWTEYCDALYDILAPVYDNVRLDGNGKPVNSNTGIDWSWSPATVPSAHSYHFGNAFYYQFDWRLSPLDVADDLNDYIECVKQKTGHDKIVLVSRCMGTNYAMAYLYKYERPRNYSGITASAWLNGAMNGMDWTEALYSGTVVLEPDSAYRFVEVLGLTDSIEDAALAEVLNLTVNSLKETYGFDAACKIIEKKLYPNIKDRLIARLIKHFYGTTGGSLSMINDKFEESINTVYPTDADKAEYAAVIAKATEYHDNVTVHTGDILKEAEASGAPVGIFAEYGGQQYPLSASAPYCGDSSLTLTDQSFGAVSSKVDGKLDEKYIEERVNAGFEKYISPDKQVDASTCLFPETTWFFKNAHHTYPEAIHYVMLWFLRGEKPTVSADANYPQFMNYDASITDLPTWKQLSPLQEKNTSDIDWSKYNPTGSTASLLLKIIYKMREIVLYIVNLIRDIVHSATG